MTNKKIRYRKKRRHLSIRTTLETLPKPLQIPESQVVGSTYSQGRPYCTQTLPEKGPHRITDGDNLFEYDVPKFEAVDSSFLKFRL